MKFNFKQFWFSKKSNEPETKNTLNKSKVPKDKTITIPIRYVKYCLAGVFLLGFFYVGAIWKVSNEIKTVENDKAELAQLRSVNEFQQQQLQQLTIQAATLQQNVNRLSQLEADIQKLLNSSSQDTTQTSRAGLVRPSLGGQGGPTGPLSSTDLSAKFDELNQIVMAKEQSLNDLKSKLLWRNPGQATRSFSWPAQGEVTSPFGWRISPFGGGSDFHPGIDIAGSYGDPISATADGVVVNAGWVGGYGNLVELDNGNGVHTLYGHNQNILVHVGQSVRKGDIVSLMGSTGLSTGPHVHYEVRVNGTAVDPISFAR